MTAADIADFLKSKGFEIDRRKLILPEPIKAIGEHDVPLKLHREVTVPLKVHGRQGRRLTAGSSRRAAQTRQSACTPGSLARQIYLPVGSERHAFSLRLA